MSLTLDERPQTRRAAGGGLAARRAVIRWALRLLRREWRQQLLILALVTVAVAATVVASTVATDTQAPVAGTLGTAHDAATVSGSPATVSADIAKIQGLYGKTDVIENESVPVPGTQHTFDLRAQDPQRPFGGPMLSLVSGRYPAAAGQTAVTSGVASDFHLAVGKSWTVDGRTYTVTGVVENPESLLDEFALVAPGQVTSPSTVTVLFNGRGSAKTIASATQSSAGSCPAANPPPCPASPSSSPASCEAAAPVPAAGGCSARSTRPRRISDVRVVYLKHQVIRSVLMTDSPGRLPVYFISHGGGPWPWIKDLMPGDWTGLERSLQSIPGELPTTPRAVLVVSAHWENRVFAVQGQAKPQMYYDYGGFPEFTYHLQYPAPGSPEVAARVLELLEAAGIPSARDDERGFDHGMFAPMYVAWPEADVPMLQLSLRSGLDPAEHLAAGRALTPLREENVLIIGSGVPTFHDLSSYGPAARGPATEFDRWLTETMTGHVGAERTARLKQWETAPSARRAHPREEHLLPGMVAVGAAEDDPGALQYHEEDFMGWMPSSGYRLG